MKKRIGRRRFLSILRALSQLLFFLLLPGLFIGAFDGVRQLVTSAVRRSFDLPRLLPQMAEAVAVVPLTLAAGRFFCGWMCSFGALQDFLSAVSLKLLRRKFFVPERADRALKSLKYLLLAALIAVPAAGWNFFSPANPWSAFAALFEPGKLPSLPQAARGLLPGFLLLFGILLGSFFIPRFFRRYLCPLGAVLSLVSLPRIAVVANRAKTAKNAASARGNARWESPSAGKTPCARANASPVSAASPSARAETPSSRFRIPKSARRSPACWPLRPWRAFTARARRASGSSTPGARTRFPPPRFLRQTRLPRALFLPLILPKNRPEQFLHKTKG